MLSRQDAKPCRLKIRNPKLEIRNKPKDSNPNYEFQNPKRAFLGFIFFEHWKLFRISDFEFRIFQFFFGVLCAFARDYSYRIVFVDIRALERRLKQ
jgi:hypothetical protein